MLLDDVGNGVFVLFVLELSIFHRQRQPPELHLDALLVKITDHLLDRVSAEGILAGLPVAVIIEPTIVEGGPVDAQLLQFGDGVGHLFRRYVGLVTPATPAHRVIFFIVFRAGQAFTLNCLRPST